MVYTVKVNSEDVLVFCSENNAGHKPMTKVMSHIELTKKEKQIAETEAIKLFYKDNLS